MSFFFVSIGSVCMLALKEKFEEYEKAKQKSEEIEEKYLLAYEEKKVGLGNFYKVRESIREDIRIEIKENLLRGVWSVSRKQYFYNDYAIVKNEKCPELAKILEDLDYIKDNNFVLFYFNREHQDGDLDSVGTEFRVYVHKTGELEIAGLYDYDDIKFLQEKLGMVFDVSALLKVKKHHLDCLEKVQHELDVWTLEKVAKIEKI